MAPSVTQSGWKATGLYPFDRSKGLNSPLVYIQPTTQGPTTSPPANPGQLSDNILFATPKNERDTHKAVQQLRCQGTVP